MNIKIEQTMRLTIEVNGEKKDFDITRSEAEALYGQLREVLGKNDITINPYIPVIHPWHPTGPIWNDDKITIDPNKWPKYEITCSTFGMCNSH